jgi:hypothetical protein
MRFWCEIDKSRLHDDLIAEWNGDDAQKIVSCDCAACKQQSSSVQPASSKICSNVGKGPQQPSIAEDNGVVFVQSSSSSTAKDDIEEVDDERMMVDDDESSSVQLSIADDNERMLEEVSDPSPPGNNITDSAVFVQSSSSSTAIDESSSLQTLINPEASF